MSAVRQLAMLIHKPGLVLNNKTFNLGLFMLGRLAKPVLKTYRVVAMPIPKEDIKP